LQTFFTGENGPTVQECDATEAQYLLLHSGIKISIQNSIRDL